MVKHVVNAATVLHFYANQSQSDARTPSYNLKFEGKRLWSYTTQVAEFVTLRNGSELLLINDSRYSVTTSKQIRWLYQAASHKAKRGVEYFKLVLSAIGSFKSVDAACTVIQSIKSEIDNLEGKANRARSEWRKNDYCRQIAKLKDTAEFIWHETTGENVGDIFETVKTRVEGFNRATAIKGFERALIEMRNAVNLALNVELNPQYTGYREMSESQLTEWRTLEVANSYQSLARHFPRDISVGFAFVDSAGKCEAERLMGKKYVAAYRKAVKAFEPIRIEFMVRHDSAVAEVNRLWAERNARENAARDIENAEKLAAWLALESDYPPRVSVIQCRVKGGEVQTTQGARVPLADALAMVRLAKACRATGKAYSTQDKVGQYRLTSISAAGDLTIGCHFIPWDSIVAAMARYMGESL
jgi:hypothetical protein